MDRRPVGATSTQRGHGRHVRRTIKVLDTPTLPGRPEFTGAAQVAQLRRTVTRSGKKTVEVVYLITSTTHQDSLPAVLAAWIHAHWSIENKLHWVRDVTFDEDRSQARTVNAPQVMASLRNTVISILRLAGQANIPTALCHHARNPDRAITPTLACQDTTYPGPCIMTRGHTESGHTLPPPTPGRPIRQSMPNGPSGARRLSVPGAKRRCR